MASRVAEVRRETAVLPRDLAGRGPAIRVWGGGEGKVQGLDALAGEIYGMTGGFLLPHVQPLPSPSGNTADVG